MSGLKRILSVARLASRQRPLVQWHSHFAPPLRNSGGSSRTIGARSLHSTPARKANEGDVARSTGTPPPDTSSNPQMAFPCLDAIETRSATLEARSLSSGPEPSYAPGEHLTFHSKEPLLTDWGGVLPEFKIAYETWGALNADKSNVILLHTGLSASSHAHSTEANPKPGWWEKFIGPGGPLDTDRYHIICTNVIGGCYGSTGPSSIDPADGKRYATKFPILTMEDMVRAQFRLLDGLGVDKLYASVGASMGGMLSLASSVLFPDRVGRLVSISACVRSHPYSIAMRHTQRQGEFYSMSGMRKLPIIYLWTSLTCSFMQS
jgi:alpha/beta hydrolase fold